MLPQYNQSFFSTALKETTCKQDSHFGSARVSGNINKQRETCTTGWTPEDRHGERERPQQRKGAGNGNR